MDQERPVFVRVARIVAASGLAAGFAAGIAALVLPRQKQSRVELAETQVRTALTDAQRRVQAAQRSDIGRKARRAAGHVDAQSLIESARQHVDTDTLASSGERVRAAGRDVVSHATELLRGGSLQPVSDRARAVSERLPSVDTHGALARAEDAGRRPREIDTSTWKSTARKALDHAVAGLDSGRIELVGKSGARDASKLVEQLRDMAKDGKGRYSEAALGALHDAADLLSQATDRSRAASEGAVASLLSQRESAGDTLQRARKQGGEQLHDLESYVSDTVERLRPQLTKAGEQAGHAVEDLRSRLSDQLDHLAEVAQDQRPHLAEATERASSSISSLLKEAESHGEEWLNAAEGALRDAEQVVQENASAARRVAGEAAGNAAQGTKAFGSLLFWLTVAIGLVYAFLMDEEQKRKSREWAECAFKEGRELYRDVRGRDGDFSA